MRKIKKEGDTVAVFDDKSNTRYHYEIGKKYPTKMRGARSIVFLNEKILLLETENHILQTPVRDFFTGLTLIDLCDLFYGNPIA